MTLKESFRNELRLFLEGAQRVAILGVGNDLRADDIAGILVSEYIATKLPKNVFLFIGESLPENYTGPIRSKKPTHVLLVDAAEFDGGEYGDYGLFDKDDISNFSFTTHSLPLSVFIDFLHKSASANEENRANFKIIGIKPRNTEFNEKVSPEIEEAAKEVADILLEILNEVMIES